MIVKVTLPGGTNAVRYGIATLKPDPDDTLDVPQYVAKTLCGLAGVTCDHAVTDTIQNYLSGAEQYEANYLLIAQNIAGWWAASDKIALAQSTFTANGEPAASLG
jgi:hypothetical protein